MLATWQCMGKTRYIKDSRVYIYGIKVGRE
ncbi:hypothetical protein Cp4451_01221 [Clostridium perfringens NCTC 8239]|nr:hypothetical protein [Clostridium perfringens NCTC 8239]CAG9344007.1 Uncharacterised protein [Clostridium perfringens NCTC 8239]